MLVRVKFMEAEAKTEAVVDVIINFSFAKGEMIATTIINPKPKVFVVSNYFAIGSHARREPIMPKPL